MEFRNLTPFDAMCFSALDHDDIEHAVVAMKIGYSIEQQEDGTWYADVMDGDALSLCMADEFEGKDGESNLLQESDLAPFKPRCDVIVRGHAHAPGGVAAKQWETRVRLSVGHPAEPVTEPEPPRPLNPLMGLTVEQLREWEKAKARANARRQHSIPRQSLLDKRLVVSGPSQFKAPNWLAGWRRGEIEPASSVALSWEHAFGGRSLVPGEEDTEPLLHEVCFSNPLGTGWLDKREHRLAEKARQPLRMTLPAPQIEYPGERLSTPVVVQHPDGQLDAVAMAAQSANYGARPAGYGFTGRSWAPRLALAGTYDEDWLENRHPGLPEDFDFAYWNGAPADQQIDYPPDGFRIELWNLTDPALVPGGHLSIDMPRHRPFLLLRMLNGVALPLRTRLDTIVIDTDAMVVSLTHRFALLKDAPVRVLEARFEVDDKAPLLRLADPQEA